MEEDSPVEEVGHKFLEEVAGNIQVVDMVPVLVLPHPGSFWPFLYQSES